MRHDAAGASSEIKRAKSAARVTLVSMAPAIVTPA
jgi:hypothetical protein